MCGSDSIFLIAFSTEGTGPRTTDPTFSSPSCRFMAIRYSSSTTRMRRSRSAELAILHLLRLSSGERKRDRAMDAIGFDREARPSAELIGQGVLDQSPTVARSPRLVGRLSDFDTAFLPVDKDPGRIVFILLAPPPNVKMPASPTQRTVFHRVGRELVQGHRQRLHHVGSKHNVL